jgi:hypothetical protein
MRGIVLAVVAIQIGLALPARAETSADSDRSIGEALPLFDRNHCGAFRDPADQLFCGDPELNDASAKLTARSSKGWTGFRIAASRSKKTRNGSETAMQAAVFLENKVFQTRRSNRPRLVC